MAKSRITPLVFSSFAKHAAAQLAKPFGAGDARRSASSLSIGKGVAKGPQTYAQPTPPMATTNPGTINPQKALAPPPIH